MSTSPHPILPSCFSLLSRVLFVPRESLFYLPVLYTHFSQNRIWEKNKRKTHAICLSETRSLCGSYERCFCGQGVCVHTHTLESHPTPHSKRQVYKRKFCSFIDMMFMLHGSLQDEGPRPRAAVFLYSFGRTDTSYLCERAEAMTQ